MTRRSSSEAARVVHLVLLDARNVMARIEERKGEMIALFSRHRDRRALLGPIRTWMDGASISDLLGLSPAQLTAVSGFYERLDALHWYFSYTEDMPGTAEQVFTVHRRKLGEDHRTLEETLGKKARPRRSAASAPRANSRAARR